MDYRIHTGQFEGPLDLLLYLVEKAEVDIRDVFMSEITSQFLEYVRQLDVFDMEQASEFIYIAATLIYVKSRSFFPREINEEDSDEDPEVRLIRQLQEYKLFKQISSRMRELNLDAELMRTKPPEEFAVPPPEIILRNTNADSLFAAMLRALDKQDSPRKLEQVHEIVADRFTVRSCAGKIRSELSLGSGQLMFSRLIDGAPRMEVIVSFMALLEMFSNGEIRLEQERAFEDIRIIALKLRSDDDDINYVDEFERGMDA